MAGEDPFEGTAYLGLARTAKRDPHRLSLFAQHLEPGERVRAFLSIHGGTLLVTDRRLLELRSHLEIHGAWNVREFQGYEVRRAVPLAEVRGVERRTGSFSEGAAGAPRTEDAFFVTTTAGPEGFVVSRGPETTLPAEDFETLRAAILSAQAK